MNEERLALVSSVLIKPRKTRLEAEKTLNIPEDNDDQGEESDTVCSVPENAAGQHR